MISSIRFSFQRLFFLIRNDIQTQFKSSLVVLLSIIFGLTLISLLSKLDRSLLSLHQDSFEVLLIVGGYLITANAFKTLHQRNQVGFYLSLPASVLEKFLSRLLLTSFGYILGLSLLYLLFSTIAAFLSGILTNEILPVFNPFQSDNFELLGLYIITHSIFLVGSIQFKNLQFIKTLASCWIVSMIIVMFTIFMIWSVLDMPMNNIHIRLSDAKFKLGMFSEASSIIKYFLYFGIAPFFWLIAFLKLKEFEV